MQTSCVIDYENVIGKEIGLNKLNLFNGKKMQGRRQITEIFTFWGELTKKEMVIRKFWWVNFKKFVLPVLVVREPGQHLSCGSRVSTGC